MWMLQTREEKGSEKGDTSSIKQGSIVFLNWVMIDVVDGGLEKLMECGSRPPKPARLVALVDKGTQTSKSGASTTYQASVACSMSR